MSTYPTPIKAVAGRTIEHAHLLLLADLHHALRTTHLVTPSTIEGDDLPVRGWTLRKDPLNAHALRFDWIHGTTPTFCVEETRAAIRSAVLATAREVATRCGYRVVRDGTGLYLTTT